MLARTFLVKLILALVVANLFIISTITPAIAQNQESESSVQVKTPTENIIHTASEEATLTLLNRKIITFHANLLGMSPKSRAARAELVINEHLKKAGKDIVSTSSDPIGTLVKIDDNVVFVISNEDVANAHLLSTDDIIANAVNTLKQVVIESHQSSNVEFMTQALVKTSIAVIIFFASIWLLSYLRQLLEVRLLKLTNNHHLNLGGAEEHFRNTLIWLVKYFVLVVYWILILLLSYESLSFVLEQFPQSRAWGEQLHGYLLGLSIKIGMAILLAIPDIFTAFIIFMIARFAVQGSNKFFNSVASGRTKVSWIEQDVAGTTKRIVNVVIWLFAFVMAYPYLPGSGTEAFKGISVLVGLMLSLGASSLVSQAGSGLILTYTRTFRRGEYVSIGEHEGTVVELGLFNTRIRTGMGIELVLPNSLILNDVTKNYSRMVKGSGFIIDATVTIGYDTPWRQVEAMLVEAATNTKGVLSDPAPQVFQTALSDFYPEYKLVCQAIPTDAVERVQVISALNANIQDVFNTYGVQIMSPQYYDDPEIPKTVPAEQWYKAPAKPPVKK